MQPRGASLAIDNETTAQANKALVPGVVGQSYFITKIVITNGATAGSLKLVADPAGTPVDLTPLMYFAINSNSNPTFDSSPIKVPVGKGVGFTSTTVTTHGIQIFGYLLPTAA